MSDTAVPTTHPDQPMIGAVNQGKLVINRETMPAEAAIKVMILRRGFDEKRLSRDLHDALRSCLWRQIDARGPVFVAEVRDLLGNVVQP